jgi:hypothetical protein
MLELLGTAGTSGSNKQLCKQSEEQIQRQDVWILHRALGLGLGHHHGMGWVVHYKGTTKDNVGHLAGFATTRVGCGSSAAVKAGQEDVVR